MAMYFSKHKFDMDYGHSPESQTWTTLCNGKQVSGTDRFICGCKVREDLVFQVAKDWCVRGHYRRKTIEKVRRKACR